MAGRVTIQDIADALGLSRNTVSKAINNTGILADATREKILLKAVEMGYKQFSYVSLSDNGNPNLIFPTEERVIPDGQRRVISLLTGDRFDNSHFGSPMLDKFQRELSQIGYSFMTHEVTDADIAERRLPASVNLELTAGFLCIELFHMEYAEYLCSLGIPTLFVDAPTETLRRKLNSDILIMDNRTGILACIAEFREKGMKKFGFIGDIGHCRSFCERYLAMQEGMMLTGLPYTGKYSITSPVNDERYPSSEDYRNFLLTELRRMKELPDVFLCANDFVAMDVLSVFRELGIRVPDDVCLVGFDDSPESRVMTPALTTIHIHSQIMGFSAVNLLLSRIREPSLNYRMTVTESTLFLRASTRS